MFLIRHNMPEGVQDSTGWLNTQHSVITIATMLMPFAGISFLWFVGVVRDGFGRFEDRFFASVFLGSGLLFLAMMFVATAIAAGLAASKGVIDPAAHTEVIDFGKFVVLAITKTYAIRMAAVFMMSLATIWLKTGLMPRWLVAISYLVAAGAADRRRPEHVGDYGLPGVGAGSQRLDTGPLRTSSRNCAVATTEQCPVAASFNGEPAASTWCNSRSCSTRQSLQLL